MREFFSVLTGIGLFAGVFQHMDGPPTMVVFAATLAMFGGGWVMNSFLERV